MIPEQMEGQLEGLKKFLLVGVGAAFTLLAVTIMDILDGNTTIRIDPLWFILQVAFTPIGFYLLTSKAWKIIPLSARINTAFGYLAIGWVLLLALGFSTAQDGSNELNVLVLLSGIALGASYHYLKKIHMRVSEDVFP
ncbi:MAG: hypothetical protein AB1509_03145 [Chloroflexota bacterium]